MRNKHTLIDEIFGKDADLVRKRGSYGPNAFSLTRALKNLGLHPMERLTMRELLDCRYRLEPVTPSIKDIAAALGRSYRQAWEWLARLELRGLVKIERRKGRKSLIDLAPFIVTLRKLLDKSLTPVKGVVPVVRPLREKLHKQEQPAAPEAVEAVQVEEQPEMPAAPESEEELPPLHHTEAKLHWERIKERIRPKVSSAIYRNYVEQTAGYAIRDGELYVLVGSEFHARHMAVGLGATVNNVLWDVNCPYKIRYFALAATPKKSWLWRAAEFMGQSAAAFL